MTNGMERLEALKSGRNPDRVPIVCNLPDHGARELKMPIRDYYSNGELVAEGQLKLREKYGYDTLLGMFYSALEAEVLGCRNIIYADDGPPNVGHLIVNSPDDIRRLSVPDDLHGHPRFHELETSIRIMKKESQGRYPVLGVVTASFSLPPMLMGIGPWMELFMLGDAVLRDMLLQKCSKFCSMQIEALRAAGADLIAYVDPVASATVITTQQFRDLALPWVINDLAESGTAGIIFFNGGGRINPILADLRQHTSINAFYLNPFDDIAEARYILGPEALIAGSINDIRLTDWTPEEIETETSRIMSTGKRSGAFIFGTMLMPYGITETNIQAVVDAAIRHGGYSQEAA